MFGRMIEEALVALFVAGLVGGAALVGGVWAICKYLVPHIHVWWS